MATTATTATSTRPIPRLTASQIARLSTAEIKELFAESVCVMSAAAGLISLLSGELDRRQAYREEGATSLPAWMVESGGVSAASARALAQVGEHLFDLPHLAAALSAGEISFDK